jgi:hypothetical protein
VSTGCRCLLAVGVYWLWRNAGFPAGALLARLIADLWGLTTAVWVVAALTAGSGLVAAASHVRDPLPFGYRPLIGVSRSNGSTDAGTRSGDCFRGTGTVRSRAQTTLDP